jgi:hypothetical protein
MPNARKRRTTKKEERSSHNLSEESLSIDTPSKSKFFSRRNIILIGLLVLCILVWKFKGYFIVAIVNNQPISRFELDGQLKNQFGQQVLDNLINERLILAAIRQRGIFIKTEEIDQRIKQLEERLQGKATLSQALSAQGMTEAGLKRQIEIQLSIERMFEKESTVSAAEIDDFIKKNSALYKEATDPAALREEIKGILSQQKISQSFENWFTDIRKNANIKKFL